MWIFVGAMYTYVGSRYFADVPASMAELATVNVIDSATDRGRAYLHVMVVLAIILTLIVWWVLRRTMFGRSLCAIGGDFEAARRAGFRVVPTQIALYVIVGVLAAMAGVAHMIMSRSANPQDLVGDELHTCSRHGRPGRERPGRPHPDAAQSIVNSWVWGLR